MVPSGKSNKEIQLSSIDYFVMKSEVMCGSKYSDAKIDALFEEDYKNKYVQWDGIVSSIKGDSLRLKMKPSTISYDVEVKMDDEKQLFDLVEDQTVRVQFRITGNGGCMLPITGRNGQLI